MTATNVFPVAVCVLTNDNADHSWRVDNAGNVLCAKVAKEVHDFFGAKTFSPNLFGD